MHHILLPQLKHSVRYTEFSAPQAEQTLAKGFATFAGATGLGLEAVREELDEAEP